MKLSMLISVILLFSACNNESAHDPKAILKKANETCKGIQNGSYEMTKYMKYMSEKDTVQTSYTCYFKKIGGDTLFSKLFHYKMFSGDKYEGEVMYTGNELVTAYQVDSNATVISKKLWAGEFESYANSFDFYSPITEGKNLRLSNDTDFIKPSNFYKFVGQETIKNRLAYHVQVNEIQKSDAAGSEKTLRVEYNYWIDKSDFMPLQYSAAFDMVMDGDTMYQYEKVVLNKFETNNLKDESFLKLSSLPSFYKRKDFVPYVEPLLLPNDTLAPDWDLPSLTGKKVRLKDLRGHLVLLDFFYKGCYPCMQALPALQALSETYKSKGLSVVGVDPNDKKEDNIAHFLLKRGVTYTVVLDAEEVATKYRVFGYPTLYLIDGSGKIILSQVGYGKETEAELEEVIKKNLK